MMLKPLILLDSLNISNILNPKVKNRKKIKNDIISKGKQNGNHKRIHTINNNKTLSGNKIVK